MKSSVSNLYSEPLENNSENIGKLSGKRKFENFYRLLQNSREWLHATNAIVMYLKLKPTTLVNLKYVLKSLKFFTSNMVSWTMANDKDIIFSVELAQNFLPTNLK